jgi:hypothetical protein
MTRIAPSIALLALACALPAAPAWAVSARTFVAGLGSDANPCSFALPCRTIQAAYNATAPGGEIDVLDPAGYGSVTITHAISIQGHGWASMTAPGGVDAITVNAGVGDRVNLEGLIVDGLGVGQNGIVFTGGQTLDVEGCVIRNFTDTGVKFTPSASSALIMSRTSVRAIGLNGILLTIPNAAATVTGVLDHVSSKDNGFNGLGVAQPFGNPTTFISISDGEFSNNGLNGVAVSANAAATAVTVRNSNIANNAAAGLVASGINAVLQVTRSTVTGNQIGLNPTANGQIVSFGDNAIRNNFTDGAATITSPLQ